MLQRLGELEAAVERIETNLGQTPEQIVVDAAYPTHSTIETMADQGIDLIGPRERSKRPVGFAQARWSE